MKKIEWWRICLLVVAGLINATGVTLFLVPSNVLDGGISGLSVLLSLVTPVNIAIYIVCINLPFFIIGFKKMGIRLIICSLVAIISYAFFTYVYQTLLKLDVIMFDLVRKDLFLCSIFGGLISGVGSGLTIKLEGAIDGIEVMAVMYAKKLSITVGQFVMIFNAIMYLVACFLLNNFQIGLYSIITYAIGLKAVDFVVDGFDKGKGCFIVTNKDKEIAEVITQKMSRGVTLLEAKGYYSGEHKTMMYCVVNRFEIGRLKAIIDEIDDTAFVTISDISEVMGNKAKIQRYSAKKPRSLEIKSKGQVLPKHNDVAETENKK